MPDLPRQLWVSVIYSQDTFPVSSWPTIFNMDIQLAQLAVQTGRENDYDRSWFFPYPVGGANWFVKSRAYVLWHITNLPEPFRTKIERIDRLFLEIP